ncbi:MAG: hypothetical protein HQ564_08045 [Candidatus Saganbacteria bacterium]|nr:hypothetical protein [Candidatus Saganbacteria bacterium]
MNQEQLSKDIRKFLDVYKVLGPEGRAQFEAQLAPLLFNTDKRSQGLYSALLSAAKDDATIEEAISKMEDAGKLFPLIHKGKENQPKEDK